MLGLCCWGLSLAAVSGGRSSDAVRGLLTAEASLIRSRGSGCMGSSSWGSGLFTVATPVPEGLICPTACEIFLDQGLNQCLLRWQVGYLPLSHQGSPMNSIFANFLYHQQKRKKFLLYFSFDVFLINYKLVPIQGSYQIHISNASICSHACFHFLKFSLYLDVFPPITLLLALM